MTCKTCGGTGVIRVPLFTSAEERPCSDCLGRPAPKIVTLASGCPVTVVAGEPLTWFGALQFRCDSGHWHMRREFLSARAA